MRYLISITLLILTTWVTSATATITTVTAPAYSTAPGGDPYANQALLEEIREIRKLLQRQAGLIGESPAYVRILENKCASCHSVGSTKGGGFNFLSAGRLTTNLSDLQILHMIKRMNRNEMPPGPDKLTNEEFPEVVDGLAQFALERNK